ncbi:MAG: YHYH protein [Bacteroidota bacterium]
MNQKTIFGSLLGVTLFGLLTACNPQPEFTGQVSLVALNTEIQEANASLRITFTLDGVNTSDDPLSVAFSLGGTAVLDEDYTVANSVVQVNSGLATADLVLSLVQDEVVEDDESIIVTLDAEQVAGLTLGATSSVTLTILDDDEEDGGIDDGNCPNDNSLSFDLSTCTQTPEFDNEYSETVNNGMRMISANSIPNHMYQNNRTELTEVQNSFRMPVSPSIAGEITKVTTEEGRPDRYFGVSLNGVILAPTPAQPFIFTNTETGEYNWGWVFEPTNNMGSRQGQVDLDCAAAHIGPQGYHYHGNMLEYAETLLPGVSDGSTVPTAPLQMGWASDGFPILYLYAPDASGNLFKPRPSYQVKEGLRPGDGVSAPCGSYNGKYTNDYEYVAGLGDLDACNGIARSITLTTTQGEESFEYFYVITETFPQVPRCMAGTPDESFNN